MFDVMNTEESFKPVLLDQTDWGSQECSEACLHHTYAQENPKHINLLSTYKYKLYVYLETSQPFTKRGVVINYKHRWWPILYLSGFQSVGHDTFGGCYRLSPFFGSPICAERVSGCRWVKESVKVDDKQRRHKRACWIWVWFVKLSIKLFFSFFFHFLLGI
jgi:hypothetical protein